MAKTEINKGRIIGYAAGLAVLAYGVYASGFYVQGVDSKWIYLAIALYAIPLACQLFPSVRVRAIAMWLGVFLVVQGLVSPFALSFSKDFKTLPPNMDTKLEVLGPGTPGIEGLQHITTDGKGFRAYPPVNYQAKHGLRIFAIGGSTTENGLLDDQEIWPYLLQEELKNRLERPVEVINTGVSGTRAVHHLATLRHVLEYKPDIVLFLLGANDWNKHIREHYGSSYYQEHKYLFRDTILGHIADLLLETGRAASADGEAIERFNGDYYTQQNNSLGRPDQRSFRPSEVASDYRATLQKISAVCKASGIECIFVTQPNGYAVDASDDFTRRRSG